MIEETMVMTHYTYPPVVGGVESVMQKHAELLSDHGYLVKILSGRGESQNPKIDLKLSRLLDSAHPKVLEMKKALDKGEIPPNFYSAKDEIKGWLTSHIKNAKLIIAHNICTLHKNLPFTAALYEIIQENPALRLIAWNHDFAWTNIQYQSQVYDRWPWDLLKKTWSEDRHTHVTISMDRQRLLAELLEIHPAKIEVIPSGIELPKILGLGEQTVDIIRRFSLLDAYPILLLPARITKRKNIELAMRIVSELKTHYPTASLIVTGPPGPHNPKNRGYFGELLKLRSQLGLDPNPDKTNKKARVVFLAEHIEGFISSDIVFDLFRISDALLFPSLQEGFGIPVLEAGINGIPIFCSDIQPFHETAGDYANYFQLNDSPPDIARKVIAYLDKSKTSQLKRVVRQKYTWEGVYTDRIKPLISGAFAKTESRV